jgi:hypothetical protein
VCIRGRKELWIRWREELSAGRYSVWRLRASKLEMVS